MKKTQKNIISIMLALVMILLPASQNLTTANAETMCYVTKTGKKYHSYKCGNGTYYQSTLSAAKKRGLTPCSKCWTGGISVNNSSSSNESSNSSSSANKNYSINKTAKTIYLGETYVLKIKNANTYDVEWSSNKPSVAEVDYDGTVTANKTGKATITAKIGSKKFSCKVTVKAHLSTKSGVLRVYDGKTLKKTIKAKGMTDRSMYFYEEQENLKVSWDKNANFQLNIKYKKAGIETITVGIYDKNQNMTGEEITFRVLSYPDKSGWITEDDFEGFGIECWNDSSDDYIYVQIPDGDGSVLNTYYLNPNTDTAKTEENIYINEDITYRIVDGKIAFSTDTIEKWLGIE